MADAALHPAPALSPAIQPHAGSAHFGPPPPASVAPTLPPDFVWSASPAGRQAPLVIAAGPLLELCAAMKSGQRGNEVERLHREAFRAIRQFEDRAAPLGLAPKMLKASKYALCATLDDVAMNSTWGSRSIWTSRSLVGAHFSETWGGDRFFDLLEQMRNDARGNIELLELLYCCLSLGFEGRFRVSTHGAGELQLLREDLYRVIRTVRGQAETGLSVRWRGVTAPSVANGFRFPLWASALTAAAIVLGLYLLLMLFLNPSMRMAAKLASELPPTGAITLLREPVASVVMFPADRLRGFLEPEIREGLVTVAEDDHATTVTIRGDGMFASAEDQPLAEFQPLLQRIGRALEAEAGRVVIEGHTDALPIRSAEFPSNDALSLARANAVATVIKGQVGDPGRVLVEGRGATEPIATNETPRGRALNRRTEVILLKEAP